jgi:hypothetical protein
MSSNMFVVRLAWLSWKFDEAWLLQVRLDLNKTGFTKSAFALGFQRVLNSVVCWIRVYVILVYPTIGMSPPCFRIGSTILDSASTSQCVSDFRPYRLRAYVLPGHPTMQAREALEYLEKKRAQYKLKPSNFSTSPISVSVLKP